MVVQHTNEEKMLRNHQEARTRVSGAGRQESRCWATTLLGQAHRSWARASQELAANIPATWVLVYSVGFLRELYGHPSWFRVTASPAGE